MSCQCRGCVRRNWIQIWVLTTLLSLAFFCICAPVGRSDEKPRPPLTKRLAMLDADLREGLQQLKRDCPACQTYINVGKMGAADGQKISVAFVVIRGNGTEWYVDRVKTRAGLDIITVIVPGATLDLEFVKFLKGGIENE